MPDKQLLVLVGESGSGKSTLAKSMVKDDPRLVRVNRDELRISLLPLKKGKTRGRRYEDLVARTEQEIALEALLQGRSVVVDNTHLNPRTVEKWETVATNHGAQFKLLRMETPLYECLQRDALREGSARVGRAVIERQFLESGRMNFDPAKRLVLVDVDGTLADMTGVRLFFEEKKVNLDRVVPTVAEWVRGIYAAGEHTVCIVSGRHSTCGDMTVYWLKRHNIPFHHIFMRHAWCQKGDQEVKLDILNALRKYPQAVIDFVIDDRPKVVEQTWRANGIKVYPVGGTTIHREGCQYTTASDSRYCPDCGALEDF